MYTPYLPAQAGSPQESTSSGGTSSSSSPEKMSGTMKAEIVKLLTENGIPSDVDALLTIADKFLSRSKSLSNYTIFGGQDEDYSMSDLIKIQKYANDVKYNVGLRKDAISQVTKEAAGSEVALTSRGQMYVMTKDGDLKRVTPGEYAENRDSYTPLTNEELLYYREHETGLAFDTGILNDLQNTIGMESITKYLKDTINSFGSDTIQGYTTKSDSVNRGLALLTQAGPEGYYKFKNKDELRDVKRALHYLYNGMSDNAKNLLKAKTAVEGADPNDTNSIDNLLLQALYEHTSMERTVDFDKQATDFDPYTTGKKGGSSTEQTAQDTYQIRFGEGRGMPTQVLLTPTAAKINDTATMMVQGTDFGPMEDWDNKQLGQMNLPKLLKEWALGTSVRNADITFGNKLLDYSELPTIMYDGQSLTTSVYLPYKEENGHYTPDFDLFTKFNAFSAAAKGLSPVERNTLAQKFGLDDKDIVYNPDTGGYTLRNTMRFVTFSAYAGDDTIKLDANNKLYLEKVSRTKGSTLKDPYNKALRYNDIYADEKKGIIVNKGYDKATSNDFWRGNVFIAAPDAFYGYNSSANEYMAKEAFNNIDRRVQANNMIVDAVNYARYNDPDYYTKSKIGQFNE